MCTAALLNCDSGRLQMLQIHDIRAARRRKLQTAAAGNASVAVSFGVVVPNVPNITMNHTALGPAPDLRIATNIALAKFYTDIINEFSA